MRVTFLLLSGLLTAGCAASQNRDLQLISGSASVYPTAAKAAGIEGSVVVRYDVSVDGRVINARIDSAEPEAVFDKAALQTVRSWRYNPALRAGKPVSVQNVISTVDFQLEGADAYRKYDR